MITTERPTATSPWPRIALATAALVFLAVFIDLLLTSQLPRVPLIHDDFVRTVAHGGGGVLLAWQLALLLPDRRGPLWAAGGALLVTVAFALGIELLQELRPIRTFEVGDAVAGVAGAAVGALVGLAIVVRPHATRQRARLVLALITIGCAAAGALVTSAAIVVDRIP